MKSAEAELLELSRKLSPEKRREWLKIGRQLSTPKPKKTVAIEEDGDAAWERIIADPKPRPKLDAMAEKIRAELRAGKRFSPMRVEDL